MRSMPAGPVIKPGTKGFGTEAQAQEHCGDGGGGGGSIWQFRSLISILLSFDGFLARVPSPPDTCVWFE